MNDEAETDTWYVLADGTHAHPGDVSPGEDGVLRSKEGVPVSLRENGLPLTSGVATKSNKQAAEAGADSAAGKAKARRKTRETEADDNRELKAGDGDPAARYETR
jgi:hypothetical protein